MEKQQTRGAEFLFGGWGIAFGTSSGTRVWLQTSDVQHGTCSGVSPKGLVIPP